MRAGGPLIFGARAHVASMGAPLVLATAVGALFFGGACGGKSSEGSVDAATDAASDVGSGDGATSSDASDAGDDGASDAAGDALPSGDCNPKCGPNEYCFLSYPRADAGDPLDARDPYFKGCLPAPAACNGALDCACIKSDTYQYCSGAEECVEHAGAVSVTCLR